MSCLILLLFSVSKVFTIRVFAEERPQEVSISSSEGTHKIKALADGLLVDGKSKSYFQEIEAERYTIKAGDLRRSYEGGFTFYASEGELFILNYIPEEAYLASVVSSEMPSAPAEALKAQAILARTYVYKNVGRHGDYDLCDAQHCQVYRGLPVSDVALEAVKETEGLVLGYKGEIADIYYHSTCGGSILLPSDVWPGTPDKPYHKRMKDTLCIASPFWAWDDTFRLDTLALRLGFSAMPDSVRLVRDSFPTPVKGFIFYAPDSAYFDYDAVANALDHRPATRRFNIELNEEFLIIHGRGYGHAVGLCQVGAIALAKAGATYRDILGYYFPGTEILSLARAGKGE